MKRFSIIMGGLVLSLLLSFTVTERANAQQKIENPDITVGINGMSCPFCAYGVTKKLKKLEGVITVYVSVDKGTADIELNAGTILSEEQILNAVADAGFEVRSIEYHNEEAKPESDDSTSQ